MSHFTDSQVFRAVITSCSKQTRGVVFSGISQISNLIEIKEFKVGMEIHTDRREIKVRRETDICTKSKDSRQSNRWTDEISVMSSDRGAAVC